MARKVWKKEVPTSLRHAMKLCVEYAKVKRNLSIERIADQMGIANHWTVYKWVGNGRIPTVLSSGDSISNSPLRWGGSRDTLPISLVLTKGNLFRRRH